MNTDVSRAVRLAAEALVDYPFHVWNWGDSVGFDGLLAAGEVLGTSRYADIAYGIARGWQARRHPFRFTDQTIPGAALCAVAEREGDEGLLVALRQVTDSLRARPRTASGVFHHFSNTPVADGAVDGEGPGVFVDCMHFDGPFFARLARARVDVSLAEEATRQLLGQVQLLQDPRTGLFHHFWLERTGRTNGIAWGRGQGWAMLGLVSALENLPTAASGREALAAALQRQARAVVALQLDSGGWRTIVDDPDSYEETSVACFMAAAFGSGIRQGILPGSFVGPARRAWARALSLVDERGLVRDTSAGTPPGFGVDHYRAIARDECVPWGQGPFLVAAWEMDRLGAGG